MIYLFLFISFFFSKAQTSHSSIPPTVHYILSVNESDLSGFDVEMQLTNMPATFHLAMVAHPEYDDRYWRYLTDLDVKGQSSTITKEDSALWLVQTNPGNVLIHYRIKLPPSSGLRASWRPFLSSTGGLVGGTQSFLYILGSTNVSSKVSFKLPRDWDIATALDKTNDPTIYSASSVENLIDAPALIGKFKRWTFQVRDATHHLIYWSLPGSTTFDSELLITQLKKITTQAGTLFGGFPYKEYYFLLQDGAYGALEHSNSVTIGATPEDIKRDTDLLSELSHEYFHAWNLVRMHPAEFHDVVYKDPPLAKELWWSEGLTMFYSDLLLRRAHLPVEDPTRIAHLERILNVYYNSAGNQKLAPVQVSRSTFARPGMLGDYLASTHIQGEMIGSILDLIILNATNGSAGIDDVMKSMWQKFNAGRGFTSVNVEMIVENKCHCDVHTFFKDHVYGNKLLDLNEYLKLIGVQAKLTTSMVSDKNSNSSPDIRLYAWLDDAGKMRLIVTDPEGIWGKAGLHTNDELVSINDKYINSTKDFYRIMRSSHVGDIVQFEIRRPTGIFSPRIEIKGYQETNVHLGKLDIISAKQDKLYKQWAAWR